MLETEKALCPGVDSVALVADAEDTIRRLLDRAVYTFEQLFDKRCVQAFSPASQDKGETDLAAVQKETLEVRRAWGPLWPATCRSAPLTLPAACRAAGAAA